MQFFFRRIAVTVFALAACGHQGGTNPPTIDGSPGDTTAERAWTWDFDDGAIGSDVPTADGAIRDASGHGATATAASGLRFTPGELTGDVAIAFDAAGDGLWAGAERISRIADVEPGESFWIEVVFRTDVHGQDGTGGRGTLVGHGDPGGAGWWLEIIDGHPTFSVSTGGDIAKVAVDEIVSDGRWHRVVAQRRVADGTLALSLDGRRSAQTADLTAGGAVSTGTGVRVAASSGGEGRLLGEIDLVRFTRGADVPLPADVSERATSVVFRANSELTPGSSTRTYAAFRIPSVVRAPDGSLLAFAEGRVNDQCDFGDIEIVSKRSTDGGKTWSALQRVVDDARNKVGNPVPIVDAQHGRIVLLVTFEQMDPALCDNPASSCACEAIAGTREMRAVTSDDSGATWSAPRLVMPASAATDWSSFLMGPGHGIQLEHGPAAGALVAAGPFSRTAGGGGGYLLASHDGGQTFEVAASETTSAAHVNESSVAELADGSLYVNARCNTSVTDADRALGFRDEAFVKPDLSYATDPAFTRTPTFRGPVVEGSTLRWNGDDRPGDEPRILFSYPAGEHGTNAGQRHDLRVYASHDEASSWQRGKRLVGDWAAYSDLVALGDGRVGVLHEAGAYFDAAANTGRFYQRVDFISVPIEWLDDDTLMSWSFEQAAPGQPFGKPLAAGGYGGALTATGTITRVDGRHHSTAIRFAGDARACTTVAAARGTVDFGSRDSFAIDVVFRTSAHGTGGTSAAGTLVSRTGVGTDPAWWLRVEDGDLRFHVSACADATSLCGITPGRCDALSPCSGVTVSSTVKVSDGAWHRARLVRDAMAGTLVMDVDGHTTSEAFPSSVGFVKNEEPVCLGAFDDGSRAYTGDIDWVRLSLID